MQTAAQEIGVSSEKSATDITKERILSEEIKKLYIRLVGSLLTVGREEAGGQVSAYRINTLYYRGVLKRWRKTPPESIDLYAEVKSWAR